MEAAISTANDALKGYTFVYEEIGQQEKYMKAVKEIAQYYGQLFGPEMRKLVLFGKETKFEDPKPLTGKVSTGKLEAYKLEFREVRDEKKRYIRHKLATYWIVYGCCSKDMREAVEGSAGYADLEKEQDVAGLLAIIKGLADGLDDEQYEYWNMQSSIKKLFGIVQGPNETLADFSERFDSQLHYVAKYLEKGAL